MKRFSYIIILVLINLALCAGCGEDNPTESSSSQSLMLEGKMLDWTSGADKQLMFGKWACRRDEAFSHGGIFSDGSFRIIVTQPPRNLMRPILELIAGQNCDGYVAFSDSTVKFFKGEPVLFDGNKFLGSILWTDFLSSNPNPDYWEYYKEVYCYFDKDVAVTGRGAATGEPGTVYAYDFMAKAGWNKLLLRYQSSDIYIHTLINEKPVNGKYLFNNGVATTD